MKPVCLPLLLVLLCVAVPAAAVDPVYASFTANPMEGSAPLTVSFMDTSTGGPSSWIWDFGDGSTSTERNTVHTFTEVGAYDVTLIAERAEPHSADSRTLNIYVLVGAEVVADFSADPRTGNAPLTVQFTDLSTNATTWAWRFGDGGTSDEQNPLHTYTAPGNYTVSLLASNDFRYDTETKIGYVSVTGPVTASFTGTPRAVPVGGSVQFTDTSTGNPFTYAWDFGDGTTSSEKHPAHIYNQAGIYDVSLTAANPLDTDTRTETGYITVYDRVDARFTANRTYGPAPLAVQFNDTSTGGPTGWNWVFGDGATSTEQNPVHTYQNPGNYDVTLTAGNGYSQEAATALNYIVTVWVGQVPTGAGLPTDTNADGLCDDVNGNGRADFNDVVLYFNQMAWIAVNEPAWAFDYNGNGRIDFADVVRLFNNL